MVSQFGSLGYTITGKTADLTVVQKTIIEPFTRRVSHKHSLPKKLAVHRVLYPSMLTKVEWKEKVWKKKMHNNRENHSLMRIVKQNRFKNLGELHKEWTEAGVKASRATKHRRVKEFGYSCRIPLVKPSWTTDNIRGVLPGLRRRRTGLLLSGPKSSFQMRASFVFHLETKDLESGGRVEKGAWMASKLAWPEPHRESMGYCQEEDGDTRPNNAAELKATVKKPGLPYPLSSATNWSPPCHAELSSN